MFDKILGGAIVVAATSKIGYDIADKYERRVKDLKAFQSGMWLIRSEIDFSMTLLSEALKKCATLLQENVAMVFFTAADNLDNGANAKEAWCDSIEKCSDILNISDEDKIVLKDFANSLGCGDIDTEIQNIDKTMERLKICENLAVERMKKYGKMCKTIGVTAGLMILAILM